MSQLKNSSVNWTLTYWKVAFSRQLFLIPQNLTCHFSILGLPRFTNMGLFSISPHPKNQLLPFFPLMYSSLVSSHCKQSLPMLLELERARQLLENTIKMQILIQQFTARARESAFLTWCLPPDDSAAGWGTTPPSSRGHFVFRCSLSTCTIYSVVFFICLNSAFQLPHTCTFYYVFLKKDSDIHKK